MAPSAERGVFCGAPRPPPPRQKDAQTGRGGRGARGGRPGVPTSASGHRAGRGRGACRRSPFVRRGAGPGGGRGALSSPGGEQTVPVGWGVVLRAFVSLPGLPALTLRSYCGRSAAGFGRSATDKARRAPRPQRRLRTESGWPRRARCGPGLHPSGPPFMFVMVSQRPPGPRELGEAGERRHSGVGLPAVSHGLLPLPRPCRPPTPAWPGQRPAGATAEPGKSPGRDASGPRTRLSQGERRSQERREAQRRNPALWGADHREVWESGRNNSRRGEKK